MLIDSKLTSTEASLSTPLISVVVPTFERSNYLPRALDSILAQTWKNVEIVIVDDNIAGSKEELRTQEILKPYMEHSNIVYLKTSGQIGGGASRNYALSRCNGSYIAFLDDDDRFLPDKLEKQYLFMREHGLEGCYQDVKWVDSQERLVEYRSLDHTSDFSTEGLLKAHILHSLCPTAVYMFQKDKLLQTEGFGEVPSGQDFILMLRCIESKMRIGYMPGAYVVQYLHNGRRISLGESKVAGENMLYELKHKYFSLLTTEEQQYVRFRHYAVLAFSSMRTGQMSRFAAYAAKTVSVSPVICIKEAFRYFNSKKEV